MTRNQIAYHQLQEDMRRNRATEAISSGTLQETSRSNKVKETETHRANVASEKQKRNELRETSRHNTVTEGLTGDQIALDKDKLAETKRHNKHAEIAGYISSAGTAAKGIGSLISNVPDVVTSFAPKSTRKIGF